MSISTYWTLATRTLLRDRLRTLLAMICVTAGVMSIVALQLTTLSATSVLVAPGRLSGGGDLVVQSDLFPLSDSQLARIDHFKAQGFISAYTPIKIVSAQGVNAQGTTTTFNVCAADMTKFPLSGKVDFLTPPQGNLRVLVHDNLVVVRKDFLKALGVHVGDSVAVATDDGRAIRVTISGVVQNTPPFYGLSDDPLMFIAADTYKTLPSSSNQPLTYTHIYVDVPGHSDAAIARLLPQLQQTFPSALVQPSQQAEQRNRMNATGFRHLLQLAGLLALLIGGLGISNTVAVLLRRRTLEIAMLKTLGYKQHSLLLLFGLEVGLIGLIGGLLGSIIGVGLSFFLRSLLEQFLAFPLPALLDPVTIVSGVAIGLFLALIFGLRPIFQASQVRPMLLLRGLATGQQRIRWLTNLLLVALLVVLFFILVASILTDVTFTFEVIAGVGLGLLILGLVFRLLVSGLSRLPVLWLLPYFWKGRVQLAQRNIGRQGWRSVMTLVTLFISVLTFGLVSVIGQNFLNRANQGLSQVQSYQDNASLSVGVNEKAIVDQRLRQLKGVRRVTLYTYTPTEPVVLRDDTPATLLQQTGYSQKTYLAFTPLQSMQGFDLAHDQLPSEITLVKGDQDAQIGRTLGPTDAGTANALVPYNLSSDPLKLKLGDHITLRNPISGTQSTLSVVGFYQTNGLNQLFGQVLTDQAAVQNLAGDNLEFDYSLLLDLASTKATLGQLRMVAPSVHTTSLADLLDTYKPLIENAMGLLDLIAAMALIASLVTLANTIALEMLERRRELGILKAIGHTSRSVFSEVLLENGLIGLTGGVFGMALVLVLAPIVNGSLFSSLAQFDTLVAVPWAVGIMLAAIAICLLVAAGVSWNATRVRPLEVLRYE